MLHEPEVAIRLSRRLGIDESNRRWWTLGAVGFALFMIMLDNTIVNVALPGDSDAARAKHSHALGIQRRLGDEEGAGMSLAGLAQLSAARGDTAEALGLYRQSLAAFEAVGDRGEEARILSEMAWTHLANHDPGPARRTFFESVQAHTDVASVRGIGLSLIGLAATEAAEHRPETAVQIAAAAEVYAQQEGIVLYSDDTPGRELVDQACAALSREQVARATELGRSLTIKDALALVRRPGAPASFD